jgi:hypothetical protein
MVQQLPQGWHLRHSVILINYPRVGCLGFVPPVAWMVMSSTSSNSSLLAGA